MEEKHSLHKFKFLKSSKIRKSFEYNLLNRLKKRISGKYLIIDYRYNTNLKMPRIGLSLSSKMGKACIRNRFKRIIREIFRLNQYNLPNQLEINVLLKSLDKDLSYKELEDDFLNLISSINK